MCVCVRVWAQAVVDRIDEQLEFPLPPKPERYEMLKMFFEEHILTPTKRGRGIVVDPKVDAAYLQQLAETKDGFSGRQLSKVRPTENDSLKACVRVCVCVCVRGGGRPHRNDCRDYALYVCCCCSW
eukprot:GHVU01218584.1.p2 GENE.GHVU01218584.1~~GHVU01218584.1.p2  ORF type:complete len:126 (-),score=14.36 GHVU01218584.1:841-1218(-)